MSNSVRGEVSITLGGSQFKLVPAYEAIVQLEERTGQGSIALARKIFASNFTLKELTVIVTSGLKAAGEPATEDKVGPMLLDEGLLNPELHSSVCKFFDNILTGGKTDKTEGNEEAAKSLI